MKHILLVLVGIYTVNSFAQELGRSATEITKKIYDNV
jgi:hypothetical protein